MFKFRGKRWKDMSLYEKAVFMDIIHKWLFPIRVLAFPIALIVKLYRWVYNKD